MKASELMIGDWVQIRLGRKLKLELDQFYAQGCHEFREHPIDYFSTFDPIPLTEEILKLNGLDPISCCDLSMPRWFMSLRSGNHHVEMPFQYVHQLQQAMRLCGMSNFADTFIVETPPDGVPTPPSAPNK